MLATDIYITYKFMNIEYGMSIRNFYEYIFNSKIDTVELLLETRKKLLKNLIRIMIFILIMIDISRKKEENYFTMN